MNLSEMISFPAEPDQVAELLADPEFVRARCAATGSLDSEVDVSHEDSGGFTVTTTRTFPTDSFPAFARSAVGDRLTVRQEDRWEPAGDGVWTGHTTVSTVGVPARVEARLRLAAGVGGATQTIEGQISASIPFLGGKIEEMVHEQVTEALEVERRLAGEWLTR